MTHLPRQIVPVASRLCDVLFVLIQCGGVSNLLGSLLLLRLYRVADLEWRFTFQTNAVSLTGDVPVNLHAGPTRHSR